MAKPIPVFDPDGEPDLFNLPKEMFEPPVDLEEKDHRGLLKAYRKLYDHYVSLFKGMAKLWGLNKMYSEHMMGTPTHPPEGSMLPRDFAAAARNKKMSLTDAALVYQKLFDAWEEAYRQAKFAKDQHRTTLNRLEKAERELEELQEKKYEGEGWVLRMRQSVIANNSYWMDECKKTQQALLRMGRAFAHFYPPFAYVRKSMLGDTLPKDAVEKLAKENPGFTIHDWVLLWDMIGLRPPEFKLVPRGHWEVQSQDDGKGISAEFNEE